MKRFTPFCLVFLQWSTLLLSVLLSGCTTSASLKPEASAPPWRTIRWGGENAWACDSGEWRAVVSVERARLIYLGPKSTDTNLLHVPKLPQENFRQRGGHIFWLGPQAEWNAKWGAWPPPAEWEQATAEATEVTGAWLRVIHPRPDKNLPQLVRGYRWRDDVLLCETAWTGGASERDYQAIQIIQLPITATVDARRLSDTAPGFVRFDIKGKQSFEPDALGDEVALLSTDTARFSAGPTRAKFGFRPGTLDARIGEYGLEMGRGPSQGVELTSPDSGYETQIFLGDGKTYSFIEIEQLTPRLKSQPHAANAFTVWLKPRKLPTPAPALSPVR